VLTRAGEPFTAHTYDHDPGAVSYGAEAAAQLADSLGVEARQVFKTLVVEVDDALVVAVLPVTGSLSLKALASAAGSKRAGLAAVTDAERATGYVVGGISPLGQRRRLPTYVDSSALEHSTMLVSGGRRGLDLQLAPDTLVRLTGAVIVSIASA
jgi:Cys-tRNA(Pro)/Cys-tRNA(Cys) deacylase